MVAEAVGYDAAKQIGRKRHLTVDTLGLVLRVVSAANVGTQRCQTSPQARQTHGQSRLTSPHRLGRGAMMALRS